jgi:ABC-type uncharacterized transport system ATPase subunit
LRQDIAPLSTSLSIKRFLEKRQILVLEHPFFFPDIAGMTVTVLENINLLAEFSF